MRKIAMGVAGIGMLVMPFVGMGAAAAAEPAGASDPGATTGGHSAQGYWCNAAGIGGTGASATCYNQTDQARYAHFHVDCWAWGDNDTDQTKWVGPWGSVSFYHGCWSHVQGLEAYFN